MCFIPWQEPVKHSVPKLPIFYLGAKYFQTKVFSYSPQRIFNILFSIKQLLLSSADLIIWALNRSSKRKKSMASNPLFVLPDLFLLFPDKLCYGYLRFEGNGKIPLGM
jgi:hypothetical protein